MSGWPKLPGVPNMDVWHDRSERVIELLSKIVEQNGEIIAYLDAAHQREENRDIEAEASKIVSGVR